MKVCTECEFEHPGPGVRCHSCEKHIKDGHRPVAWVVDSDTEDRLRAAFCHGAGPYGSKHSRITTEDREYAAGRVLLALKNMLIA